MQKQQTSGRRITVRGELALAVAGTVIGALCYGPLGGWFGRLLDRHFDFVSVLSPQKGGRGTGGGRLKICQKHLALRGVCAYNRIRSPGHCAPDNKL